LLFWVVRGRRSSRINSSTCCSACGCSRCASASSTRSKLDTISNKFGTVLLSSLVLPASRLHASFYESACAFLKVLSTRLSLPSEYHNVVIVSLLCSLAIAVLVDTIGCD